MTGSLDLATTLLETLSKVVHDESQESGEKVFTIQLLMSALENVATNMPVKVSYEVAILKSFCLWNGILPFIRRGLKSLLNHCA